MQPGQSLSQLTSKILIGLENHFKINRPDLVLGHGDTTTCFTTAISSFYHHIPFYHVEAGLRTHRFTAPFPEEFNRQSVAPIASHHFAPTEHERVNLRNEGVSDDLITITGSTVHEAVEVIRSNLESFSDSNYCNFLGQKPVVAVTLHRREGLNSIEQTLNGIRLAAQRHPDAIFVCPVHPNPQVQTAFRECFAGSENVILIEPLPYPAFINLILRAKLVVTDSGGVQEEAAFLGKRVILARSETERLDGLSSGLVSLAGTSSNSIYHAITKNIGLETGTSLSENFSSGSKLPTHIIADRIERAAV